MESTETEPVLGVTVMWVVKTESPYNGREADMIATVFATFEEALDMADFACNSDHEVTIEILQVSFPCESKQPGLFATLLTELLEDHDTSAPLGFVSKGKPYTITELPRKSNG